MKISFAHIAVGGDTNRGGTPWPPDQYRDRRPLSQNVINLI